VNYNQCCRCLTTVELVNNILPFVQRRDGLICKSCADKEMIYIATPYMHPNPLIREIRFKQACTIAGKLMEEGHRVFSPIIACHPISKYFNLPGDHLYWKRVDEIFIDMCTIIYVVKYDGWKDSKGIASEIDLAKRIGKPVFYVEIHQCLIERKVTNG